MPKPVSFTHSGTVGAPLERVFALLSDAKRLPEWFPGCRTVAPKEQLMRLGARYHLEMSPRKHRVEIEIVDYQPPRALGWLEHFRRTGNKTFFKLDHQGGATRVTVKLVWHAHSFRSWLLGQFYRRRDATRMFNGTLQNLRQALTR
jgi:uncharacterized protein YndB with AHSA1/START domain